MNKNNGTDKNKKQIILFYHRKKKITKVKI